MTFLEITFFIHFPTPDFFVRTSANMLAVSTHSTSFTSLFSIISFMSATEFLNSFSSHCLVLCKFSHRPLLSFNAFTAICFGCFKSIFPSYTSFTILAKCTASSSPDSSALVSAAFTERHTREIFFVFHENAFTFLEFYFL